MSSCCKGGIFIASRIRISTAVVSHAGSILERNHDNFYINGRFKQRYEMDNIQVSIDNSDSEFVFAVFNEALTEKPDERPAYSVAREIRKVHEEIRGNGRSIDSKISRLGECVKEVESLIISASIDKPYSGGGSSFAGMVISDNKAAALNTGGNRVYLLRDGSLKLMTNDNAKLERLLKLGVITQDQVKLLSSHLGISSESQKGEILTSDSVDIRRGDVFLLCSDGLSNSVGDEKIQEMISLDEDSSFISNMLVKEALRNGGEDNITALVVKLEDVQGDAAVHGSSAVPEDNEEIIVPVRRSRRPPDPEEPPNESFKTYIAAAVACVIIAGLMFLAYKVWLNNGSPDADSDSPLPSPTISATVTPVPEDTGTDQTPEPTADQTPEQSPTPSVTPDNSPGQTDEPNRYTVQDGDSLQSISKKFYNDVNKYTLIMDSNNIEDPNLIKVGDVLIIP